MAKRGSTRRKRSKKTRKKSGFLRRQWPLLVVVAALTAVVALLGVYLYSLGFERGYKKGYADRALVKSAPKKAARPPLVRSESPAEPEPQAPQTQKPAQKSVPAASHRPAAPKKAPAPSLKPAHSGARPRLAIIIDDVAYRYQVRALTSLGIPLNLSFFPPSPDHPDTPRLAAALSHYMVHLPLEALHFHKEEPHTLRTTSTSQDMERVVERIRRLFPKARYVNNHTGSRFTADELAVRRLVEALDRYGFGLVDSRTTAKTKVPVVMRDLGRPYLHRDIFLDNKADIAYIQSQLKKAIQKAKRQGYAIAIGHPKPATIEALRRSKGILKEVQLVYIEDL